MRSGNESACGLYNICKTRAVNKFLDMHCIFSV